MGLYCRMTGGFDLEYNGEKIEFVHNLSSKAVQLLIILMYFHHDGVSKASLIEYLYGESLEVDSSNSLKALMFRLRKQMAQTPIESEEYVVYKDGMYYLDPAIEFSSDVLDFYHNVGKANCLLNMEEALPFYIKAVNSIKGTLLPVLGNEMWVIIGKATLEEEFEKIIRKLCSYYRMLGEYDRAREFYFRAKAIFPYEDEWTVGSLECLVQQGRFLEAQEEYERYKKLIFDELSVYPSDTLQACYQMILDRNNFGELNADNILSQLKTSRPSGAFRCSFSTFADNYHLLRRIMNREGIKSSLVLCGVVDENNQLVSDYQNVVRQVGYLEAALLNCLRKSDVITRYGQAQMLVLLWKTPNEKAPLAVNRINAAYNLQNQDKKYHVEYMILDDSRMDAGVDKFE